MEMVHKSLLYNGIEIDSFICRYDDDDTEKLLRDAMTKKHNVPANDRHYAMVVRRFSANMPRI